MGIGIQALGIRNVMSATHANLDFMNCPYRALTLHGNITQGAAALALGYA